MRVRVSAGLVLAVSLWGCSETEPNTGDEAIEGVSKVTAELSAEGGRLRLQSGVELRVPADALGRPVKVEMEELAADGLARPEREETEGLAQPCAFRPHGQEFERDVRVHWPLEEPLQGREVRVLRLDDEDDAEWEDVSELARLRPADELDAEERDRAGGRDVVELDLRRFSVYWIVSAPAVGGADGGGTTSEGMDDDGTEGDSGAPIATRDASFDEPPDGGTSIDVDPCFDFVCERDQVCQIVDGEPLCVAGNGSSGGGSADGGSDGSVDASAAPLDGGSDTGGDAGHDGAAGDGGADSDGGTGGDAGASTGEQDAGETDATAT